MFKFRVFSTLFIIFLIYIFGVSGVFADTTATLRPIADGGEDSANWANTGSTACDATDCYTEVDELAGASCTDSDGDTSYIETSNGKEGQTFDIDVSSITDDSIITQIDITFCGIRGQAGSGVKTRQCIDGSCSNADVSASLTDAYAETTQSFTGLSVVKSVSTDVEIGILNVAPKISRISQVSAVITYTPPDTTAPSAVADLATSGASQNSISLTWTAPGDDAGSGTATTYDVRYSTATINDGNWGLATQATGEPSPSVAGSSESFTVTGLSPSTTYYFAIKTSDEVPNESAISNVDSLATTATPDTTAPSAVSDLAASGASNNSIDLDWTAPGDDAGSGTATSYDVRYSTADITDDTDFNNATQATGEPSPSVAGSSESFTVTGLSPSTTYYFAIKTSDEVPNESAVSNVPSDTTSEESSIVITGDSGGGGVAATMVVFGGQAYPGSEIIVQFKDSLNNQFRNVPLSTYQMENDGKFYISYMAFLSGKYFFSLKAQDKLGQTTGIKSYNVDFNSEKSLIVEDILFPPTLNFGNGVYTLNEDINISGYSTAHSKINLSIDDIIKKETTSDKDGCYQFVFSPSELEVGDYFAKVSQTSVGGEESGFSFPRAFRISSLSFPRADFNKDNGINITDWSIFLYRWGSEEESLKRTIDLDDNGQVNIIDFSIFLKNINI
ncbi:fibronectin type III domain-containing protein [Patescibacteria group bacterium]